MKTPQAQNRTVITLVGSTRFMDTFRSVNRKLTMCGHIVLTVGASDKAEPLSDEVKEDLDALHLDKIDMSDGVLVLNVNGYIGSSAKREIAYAIITGKDVRFLESGGEKWLADNSHELGQLGAELGARLTFPRMHRPDFRSGKTVTARDVPDIRTTREYWELLQAWWVKHCTYTGRGPKALLQEATCLDEVKEALASSDPGWFSGALGRNRHNRETIDHETARQCIEALGKGEEWSPPRGWTEHWIYS